MFLKRNGSCLKWLLILLGPRSINGLNNSLGIGKGRKSVKKEMGQKKTSGQSLKRQKENKILIAYRKDDNIVYFKSRRVLRVKIGHSVNRH